MATLEHEKERYHMKRKIIKIDREKCDGCGLCVPACHEGAIEIIDGKATLVKDSYCDGLGDCLGECPQGAISFETREADPYDKAAVKARLEQRRTGSPDAGEAAKSPKLGGGCPGLAAFSFDDNSGDEQDENSNNPAPRPGENHKAASELRQWPVQLKLVPVQAPYWDQADLLVAADCVPTAYADFHAHLLRDRRLVIACPKLDDTAGYTEKLAEILAGNDIRSVTVAIMEFPCCGGLDRMVRQAVTLSGRDIPVKTATAGVRGSLTAESQKVASGRSW